MNREEAKRHHPAYYWREIFAPQDADDMIATAASIAPVIDITTRERIK
jgi:hypothetical protein